MPAQDGTLLPLACALSSIAVIGSFHEDVLPNAGYAAWLANPIIVAAWFLYLADRRSAALISAIFCIGTDADVPGSSYRTNQS